MDLRTMFSCKLGFGGLRLPILDSKENIDYKTLCEMVDCYVENGGQYFDTSYIYHRGQSENAFGKCIVDRLPRDSFCLADKMPAYPVGGKDDFEGVFHEQLSKCHVDYFDFYLIHNVNSNSLPYIEGKDIFSFQRKLKERGDIRYAGFSFHDTPQTLDRLLTEHSDIDFVQLQLNYYDWLSNYVQAKQCYEVAVQHDVPVVVMETVRGGGLVNLPNEAKELLNMVNPGASPASFAIRFAAGLSNVMMTLSGMSTLEQVKDNCSYMNPNSFKKLSDAEEEAIQYVRQMIKRAMPVPCTECEECVSACPKNIPISKLISIYNDGQYFGEFNFPGMHYNVHVKHAGKAGDCISCGACENVCGQNIPIISLMEIISDKFDPKKK